MKSLRELVSNYFPEECLGPLDVPIRSLAFDSRKISKGDLYFAVPGTRVDGHEFIDSAIQRGAVAIVCERFAAPASGITYLRYPCSSKALGEIAANYYDRPSDAIQVIGITGTNGKTTTATLLTKIFRSLGHSVGLLSTIQNEIEGQVIPSTHTTGDALQLQSLLRQMVDRRCSYCFMEVTSHAIVQNRIAGIRFRGGVFTNLTPEHLDYHRDMASYFAAKKSFFDCLPSTAIAVTNVDDPHGSKIVADTSAKIYTYGFDEPANFSASLISRSFSGLELSINGHPLRSHLLGLFNGYNIAAAFAMSTALGVSGPQIVHGIRDINPIVGRFNLATNHRGFYTIVDYAHTPDGLVKILTEARALTGSNNRVIVVIGCGGDRDREKRPMMAHTAYEMADQAFLTTDNPRTEDPEFILNEMWGGLPPNRGKSIDRILDRASAIRAACEVALPGDVVVIAGKGHETYQEVNNQRIPFSDEEVLTRVISDLEGVQPGNL